jgi:hypothetical protein
LLDRVQGHDFYAEAKAQAMHKKTASPSKPHIAPNDPSPAAPKSRTSVKSEIVPETQQGQHAADDNAPATTYPGDLPASSGIPSAAVAQLQAEREQLRAENDELRGALEDAGETIDQLLASERALKQVTLIETFIGSLLWRVNPIP